MCITVINKSLFEKRNSSFTTNRHKLVQKKVLSQLDTFYKLRISTILPVKMIISNRSESTISIDSLSNKQH